MVWIASMRSKAARNRIAAGAIIALFLACPGIAAAADTPYFMVTTDRIAVVTNSSAKRCSRVAFQFMRFEGVFRDLAGWDSDVELRPLKVFLLAEKDANQVFLTDADRSRQKATDMFVYSKFMPGREFNIAAMVDHDSYDDPMQSLFLTYAQSALVAGPTRQHPAWYLLGVSNLLNGLVIREDGSAILNRSLPFAPEVTDASGTRAKFDLPTLLATTRTLGLFSQSDWKEFILRARDWAEFGLLTTPERRKQYRDLAELMRQGTPADEAVAQAFGMPLAQLTEAYQTNKWRRDVQFRMPPPAAPIVVPEPSPLAADEAKKQLQIVADRVGETSLH